MTQLNYWNLLPMVPLGVSLEVADILITGVDYSVLPFEFDGTITRNMVDSYAFTEPIGLPIVYVILDDKIHEFAAPVRMCKLLLDISNGIYIDEAAVSLSSVLQSCVPFMMSFFDHDGIHEVGGDNVRRLSMIRHTMQGSLILQEPNKPPCDSGSEEDCDS